MRFFLFSLFAAFVQLAALSPALAVPIEHPGGYPFPSDARVQQKVKMDVQNVDNDEFLMELAKKADLNILVDATDAPTDAPPIDIQAETQIINFALDFAKYRGYATQRFSSDTLLFWPQSDKKSLALRLLEAHKERWNRQLADALPPESTKRAALLRAYFENQLGWNGKWEGVDLRVKVKDLPPELRAFVLSEMNAQIAYRETNIDRLLYRTRDEFWQPAKLSIKQGLDRRYGGTNTSIMVPILMLHTKPLQNDIFQKANHSLNTSLEIGPLPR